jgi:hypothetical protein
VVEKDSRAVVYLRDHLDLKPSKGISPVARLALDRCEEAFARSEWSRFGYWFEIYRNERLRVIAECKRHPSKISSRAKT